MSTAYVIKIYGNYIAINGTGKNITVQTSGNKYEATLFNSMQSLIDKVNEIKPAVDLINYKIETVILK